MKLIVVAVAAGLMGGTQDGGAGRDGPPAGVVEVARKLSPLPQKDGAVAIPLGHEEPWAWRPVRPGVTIARKKEGEQDRLTISYTRQKGKAAGAAIVVPPGSLAGMTSLKLAIGSDPEQRLLVSLTDQAGAIWSFPAFKARAGGEGAREAELEVSAVAPDSFQNKVADPGAFDPSRVVMITVLDINGFLGGAEARCTVTIGSMSAAVPPGAGPEAGEGERHNQALAAEAAFFDALNRHPERRADATRALEGAYAAAPGDSGTALWLGMAYLWAAAEPAAGAPRAESLRNLQRAEEHLGHAKRLRPWDGRIDSWLHSAAAARARLEGDQEAAAEAVDAVRRAAAADPCFHSVALAILAWDAGPGSALFKEALGAMRAASACAAGRATAQNRERWPHNLEGFSLAWAEMEARAGEAQRARAILMSIEHRPSAARWPYRGLIAERLDAPGGGGGDGPGPFVLSSASGMSCVVCHRAGE